MNTPQEQLTEDIVSRASNGTALSGLPKGSEQTAKLVRLLMDAPKAKVPSANFMRIRNQILDRISIPSQEQPTTRLAAILAALPRFLKIGSVVIGSFLILSSLAISVAVAALQSVPGQTIYPVKKVVERVQLKLASSESEKVSLRIEFANNRLEELEKVLEQNQQGKVSGAEIQKLVEKTVKDVSNTTVTVTQNASQPQNNLLNKIVNLTNKQTALLETAAINTEGEVRLEMQKALEASKESKEKTFENIERAGMRIEDQPVVLSEEKKADEVSAHGKITAITPTSVSIGTSKFLLTKDTNFVNIKQDTLKIDAVVDIKGQVIKDKTYALEIKAEATPTTSDTSEPTDNGGDGQ